MVKIKKQIVSDDVINKRSYGTGNSVDYVVVHQTGNTARGANAQSHANLQSNLNSRQASWHESVDDNIAIQSFPDNIKCWSAGDGRGPGNSTGYHIEICINEDGDYKKAVKNGAKRAKVKLDEHGLGIDRLKQHADFASKNCPAQIRTGQDGITWADFVKMVSGEKPQSTKQNKSAGVNLTVDGKWGPATTRALQQSLDTVVDGVISSQPRNSATESLYGGVTWGSKGSMVIQALQRKVGSTADGKLGPNTVRSTQRYLSTPQDGVISRPSMVVEEMQRGLNAGTFV